MAWEPPKILQVLGNVFNNRAEQPGLGGAAQQHLQNINTHQGNTWQERWLRSESKWNHRIGKNWKGKKVLGMGGQGVVGWWTYEGSDRNSKALVDIVVKQASATGPGGGLAGEAKLLDILRHTGSPHVLKMYKNLFQDEGEGVMPEVDTGLVHRILLEYCPGGDLIDYLRTRRRGGLSEEDLWGIFHCMARAIFVLEHGSEDPNKPKWNREIVHFDLKEENILTGPVVTDDEHKNMPIFKMADFGLAQEVPQVQDDLYMRQFSGRGTRPYHLPEQTRIYDGMTDQSRPWNMTRNNLLQNVRYSSASNVWQLGLIMWCLKREKMEPPWPRGRKKGLQLHQSTRSNRLKNSGPTLADQYDIDDESPSANPKYSRGLSALIAECLLIRPAERPNAAQLMARTGRGLENSRIANATVLPKPDINIPEPGSPQLSAEWLAGGTTPLMAPRQSQGYLRPSELFNEYEKNWVEAQRNKGRKVWQKKQRLRFDSFEMREIGNALPDVDWEAPQQPQRKPPVVPPRPVRNKIPLRRRRAPARPIEGGNAPLRPHLSPPEQGFDTGKPALPQGPRQQIPMTGNTIGLFGMQRTRPYVPPAPLPIIAGRQAPYPPPTSRPKKSKIGVPRSLLSSTRKLAPGPATGNLQPSPPGPPTAGRMNNFNQIMAEVHVPGFLGTSTKRVVRLRGIHPNLTILMLRRRIDQESCGIPFRRIEIQCNGMKFHDNQLVGELPARFPDQLVGRIEVVQAAVRA